MTEAEDSSNFFILGKYSLFGTTGNQSLFLKQIVLA